MKNRHPIRTLVLAAHLLLHLSTLSFYARAAPGDVDLSFDPGAGLYGQVRGAALQPDGKVIIAGDYGIARLNADGRDDRDFRRSTSNYGGPLAVQPDGKVLIGHALGVARLETDGSVDPNFTATITCCSSFEENSGVPAGALQPDGKVLIGGNFGLVNGVYRPGIARLNPDGSVDTGFDGRAAVSSGVWVIALQSDGQVLIGGRLTTSTGYKSLLRLNADGSLDETFQTASYPDDSNGVFSLAVQADGKIVAGGYFSMGSHHHIVRLTSNGEVDPDFDANATANNTVFSVRLQSDGKLLIAGGFTEMNGTSRHALARLNADGSLDVGYNPSANFDAEFGYNGQVSSMLVQPDGKLLIMGNFTEIGGVIREGFARLEADGTQDNSFNANGGVNGSVYSVLVQPDGKVLLTGDFKSVNGASRNGIARLNYNGSLDPTVFDRGIAGSFGPVTAEALQADGKVLIGTEYGLVRTHSDGTLDISFMASIGTGDDRSSVSTLAVQSDGKILVGGYGSTRVVDDPNEGGGSYWYRIHLTRLNPDGSYDTTFERTLGESIRNDAYSPQALAVLPNGKIVVAGYFFTFKGADRVGIARINSDGTLDTGFNVRANTPLVGALALQADGKLFIGGGFTFVDGVSRRRVARLNGDGSLDTSWNPGTGAEHGIGAIALQSDGKLLVAGSFNTIDGTSRQRIARLNANGSLDSSFHPGTGPDARVRSIALLPDGNLLIGGDFTTVNGAVRPKMARIYGNSPPPDSYATWVAGYGLTEAGAAASADPDKDGLPNGVEYVLGGNPNVPETSGGLTPAIAGDNMFVTFLRDDWSETSDAVVTVETGADLDTWPAVFVIGPDTAGSSPGVSISENGTDPDTITVEIPQGADGLKFARLKVMIVQ